MLVVRLRHVEASIGHLLFQRVLYLIGTNSAKNRTADSSNETAAGLVRRPSGRSATD